MLIDKVLNNILKSFKRHIINKNEIIDYNEKLLLWNNIIQALILTEISIPFLYSSEISLSKIILIFSLFIYDLNKQGIEYEPFLSLLFLI